MMRSRTAVLARGFVVLLNVATLGGLAYFTMRPKLVEPITHDHDELTVVEKERELEPVEHQLSGAESHFIKCN